MKVKIAEKGWAGYTGLLGSTEFKDGVSVADISDQEANRLGSILRIEEVDGTQISSTAEMARTRKLAAPVVQPMERGQEAPPPPAPETPAPSPMESEHPVPVRIFTQAELENIADDKGIKGLREIATPMGVKGSAIPALIAGIIDFQKKNPPKAE